MAKQKPGFMIYHDDVEALTALPDVQIGRMIRAMAAYSMTGRRPQGLCGKLAFVFSMLAKKVDRDNERYEQICIRRQAAARKRWAAAEDAQMAATDDETEAKDGDSMQMHASDANSNRNCNCNRNHNGNSNHNGKGEGEKAPARPRPCPDGQITRLLDEYAGEDAQLRALLSDWMAVRRHKRAANTAAAVRLNLEKIAPLAAQCGMTVQAYLREAVARSWATFFPLEDGAPGRGRREVPEALRYCQRRDSLEDLYTVL